MALGKDEREPGSQPEPVFPDDDFIDMPGEENLSDEEWVAAWAPEIQRRLDEARSGRVKRYTLEEVMTEIYADLKRP